MQLPQHLRQMCPQAPASAGQTCSTAHSRQRSRWQCDLPAAAAAALHAAVPDCIAAHPSRPAQTAAWWLRRVLTAQLACLRGNAAAPALVQTAIHICTRILMLFSRTNSKHACMTQQCTAVSTTALRALEPAWLSNADLQDEQGGCMTTPPLCHRTDGAGWLRKRTQQRGSPNRSQKDRLSAASVHHQPGTAQLLRAAPIAASWQHALPPVQRQTYSDSLQAQTARLDSR